MLYNCTGSKHLNNNKSGIKNEQNIKLPKITNNRINFTKHDPINSCDIEKKNNIPTPIIIVTI